jgi:uncharacterized membrane protein YheB (UPF0754 family)
VLVLQKDWKMITYNPHILAFKAGLYGLAVHPSNMLSANGQANINVITPDQSAPVSKTNHLSQSLDAYINHELSAKPFNASFLNSTAITSQEATEKFIEHLQEMTDFALQNHNRLIMNGSFFSNATSYYESFSHPSAHNLIQESLFSLADSMGQDNLAFSDLKASANQLLQSYGLPVNDQSAANMIRGMGLALSSQLGNVGHLVDIKA